MSTHTPDSEETNGSPVPAGGGATTSSADPPPLPQWSGKPLPAGVSIATLHERPEPSEHHVPIGYAPRTGLKLTIAVICVALALGIGFFFAHRIRAREKAQLEDATAATNAAAPEVDVVSAKYAPAAESIELPGYTRAWFESTIYARVSGYVEKWLVDIGDKVTKGQVLATIDTPELDAQLRAAQAKLLAADADEKVAEAGAAFAKSTYTRWKESAKGLVSEQEVEEKRAEFDSGIAKLNAAKAQVNLNEADVQSLKAMSMFKEVTAPYEGVITARRIDIGDLVTAGSTASTTSLYSIAQSNKIRVFVDVPQKNSAQINVGDDASVIANDFADREFIGKVARTAQAIDPVSRTLRVEVDVDNPDLALVPGMYVQVHFELTRKPWLEVPASALLFRSAGPEVAVVKDGKIHFHPVVIAHDQGDVVEISSGLQEHEKVALNLSSQIVEGDAVVPVERAASPSAPTPAKGVAVVSPH